MGDFFIQYRPYEGLDNIECLLMSWIVGLHKSKKSVCFTNKYAAFVLGVSESTITRSLKKISSLGYIKPYQPYGDKRFIKLVGVPPIRTISEEVCEIETPQDRVVNLTTGDSQNDEGGSQNDETHSQNDEGGVVRMTSNIIVDKIEDKIVSEHTPTHPLYPNQFMLLVEKYQEPEDKLNYCYDRWNELNGNQKVLALDSVPLYFLYLKNNPTKKKKSLQYYLSDKVFEWDALDRIKQPKQNNKPSTNQMSQEQKAALGREIFMKAKNGK